MGIQLDQAQLKERAAVQNKFGKKLAEVRTEKGITQEKLAFEIGVDRTYISYIERGKRNPSLYLMWRLAQLLQVSLVKLTDF